VVSVGGECRNRFAPIFSGKAYAIDGLTGLECTRCMG
jgi:hypothetical protein